MKRIRFTEEQIIAVLREHEAGTKTADLARKHGISEATLYNWKAKYGGMDVSDAKRLRALEDENRSRSRGGRPQVETDLRVLIRRMSIENPFWGAPRIHGELLKLGLDVAQSSVAKYMVRRPGRPSQGWCTFLRNHAPDIAAMDLFVVPTVGFDLLYAFIIIRLSRRELI